MKRAKLVCLSILTLSLLTPRGLMLAREAAPTSQSSFSEKSAIQNLEQTRTLILGFDLNKCLLQPFMRAEFVRLGWLIVATAEHAKGSSDLKKILNAINVDLGRVKIPYYVCLRDQRDSLLKELMCEIPDAATTTTNGAQEVMDSSYPLYYLIMAAQKAISARSGFDFGEYTGPVPMPDL